MSLTKIKVKYSELRKRKIGSSKKLPSYVLNKPHCKPIPCNGNRDLPVK